MNFITLCHPYIRIFYLLGQTLYPLEYYFCENREKLTKWHRFSMMAPTILMFVVKLLLCVGSVALIDIYGEVINISYDIMADIFLFCEMAKISAVLYQNFAYQELVGEILRNFQTIESIFQSTLHHPIQFTSFKRAYTKKICWAFASYTTLLILFILNYFLYDENDLYDVFIEAMQFVSISIYLNVLFFIDLVSFYLKHLNTIIAKDNNVCDVEHVNVFVVKKARTTDMIRQRISKYKAIHFRLWKTTQQLNEFFGWSLITILLQSIVEFVYNSIWQLKIVYNYWNFIKFSRECERVLESIE